MNTYRQSNAEDKSPGPVLMHQLQMIGDEVERHLSGMGGMGGGLGSGAGIGLGGGKGGPGRGDMDGAGRGTGGAGGIGFGPGDGKGGPGRGDMDGAGRGTGGAGGTGFGPGDGKGGPGRGDMDGAGGGDGGGVGEGGSAELSELASAVFDMKRQLINGIERQKSLGITYSNEEEIIDKANEITDNVLIQLIKEEYKSGQISTSRLAHILKRLVPDVKELKRLMPKIKAALLEEGMPLAEYLDLVLQLSTELESEELSQGP